MLVYCNNKKEFAADRGVWFAIKTMVFRQLFPVLLLLLWKPVYSALDNIDCCSCNGLTLKRQPSNIQPNVYPSPFEILVTSKTYTTGKDSVNVNITSTDITRQFVEFMLQAVFINDKKEIISDDSVGVFTSLDNDKYTITTDCGGRAIKCNDGKPKSNVGFIWRHTDRANKGHVIFRATIVEKGADNYWLRELSSPVEEASLPPLDRRANKFPLIPVIDTSECGVSKGCYRVPEGCWEPYCDYIATWKSNVANPSQYTIELGALTDGVTDRYVSMAISDDIRWGNDVVLQCVHNGTSGRTTVYTGKSFEDHTTVLDVNPKQAILREEGQIWGRRLRCRFDVSTGYIEGFPEGYKHILMSRGGASNGTAQKHGHGVGEIPVATPDEVSLQNRDTNIGGFARYSLVKAHGILMILAWAFFGTTGLLWTKYYKPMWPNKRFYGERYWFVAHFNCMAMLVLLVVIAFIIIFVEVGGYSKADYLPYEAHPILGIIIFCCILLNPIIALLRPAEDHKCRPVVNWIHWFFGTVAWCLAIPNMFIGMDFGKAMVPWWATWILCIYILYHIIVEITLEVHQCCTHKKNKERRKKYEFQKRDNPKARIPEPEPAGRIFKRNMLFVHFIITCIVNLIMLIAIAAS